VEREKKKKTDPWSLDQEGDEEDLHNAEEEGHRHQPPPTRDIAENQAQKLREADSHGDCELGQDPNGASIVRGADLAEVHGHHDGGNPTTNANDDTSHHKHLLTYCKTHQQGTLERERRRRRRKRHEMPLE